MFDVILTCIYLACCGYAVWRGHQKFFIVVALLLALIFQYALGFSFLAKIIIAAIFVLYFVFSETEKVVVSKVAPKPKPNTTDSSSNKPEPDEESINSVFEEFQDFTNQKTSEDSENEGRRGKKETDTSSRRASEPRSKSFHSRSKQQSDSRTPDTRTPEEILGVQPGAYDLEELRQAWIRESKRWHTSNMGNKPQNLIKLAEEELKRVNVAYDTLKKRFNS